MKILALQGSPRKNGNTDILLDRVLDSLREAKGAEVEKLYARDLDVGGCIECFACQKVMDRPGCALRDDMIELYDKILDADLTIYATPVFCWGPTAQLKAILDRLYATFKFNEDPYITLLEGKRVALIVTAGGDAEDGANVCEECCQKLFSFARASDCGVFIAPLLKQPDDTRADDDLMARVDSFADELAKALD